MIKELVERYNIIREFLPITLFAESNLPAVKIEIKSKGRFSWFEEPSLVISNAGYLPGKPIFRTQRRGVFIPLKTFFGYRDSIDIGKIYIGSSLRGLPESNLPLDLGPDIYVKRIRLDTIVADFYECKSGEVSQWLFYSRSLRNEKIDEYLKRCQSKKKGYYFYIYLRESNSYGRYLNSLFDCEKIRDLNIIKNVSFDLSRCNAHIGIYAVDIVSKVAGCFDLMNCNYASQTKKKVCKTIGLYNGCFSLNERYPRKRIYHVKKLAVYDNNKLMYHLIGYLIKQTNSLSYNIDQLINMFKGTISQIMRNNDCTTDVKLYNLYLKLSLNSTIFNYLKYLLSYDIQILNHFSTLKYYKPNTFINEALVFYNIIGRNKLCHNDNKNSSNTTLYEKLIEGLKCYNNFYNSSIGKVFRGLISSSRFGLLISGSKQTPNYNEIKARFDDLISRISESVDDNWEEAILVEVLRHTLSHHVIKSLSRSANIRPEKLVEHYVEFGSQKRIDIFEKDSGGIGVINRDVLDEIYKKNKHRSVEEFILRLGECLVGGPEDLIHFMLINYGEKIEASYNEYNCKDIGPSITEFLDRTIADLGIIITPDERREAVSLWNSLIEESCKMLRILELQNHTNSLEQNYKINHINPVSLLKEIHMLRYDLERTLCRFPDLDDVVIYLLANIDRYNILKNLIMKLYKTSIESSETDTRDKIKEITNEYDIEEATKKFISLIHSILNGYQANVDNIYVRLLYLLGRVVRGILMRFVLLKCNGSCGLCYINTRSCGRYGAPFIQGLTLDRRLLKILATSWIKEIGVDFDRVDVEEIARVFLGGKEYRIYADRV